jgi:hypothetical protein
MCLNKVKAALPQASRAMLVQLSAQSTTVSETKQMASLS